MSKTTEEVHADVRDGIGWIVFDAPGANILTRKAFERLEEILVSYKRQSVQTLVFLGARGNFCGGLWLKYIRNLQNSPETAGEEIDYFYKVGAMIREFPTTIAAIENGVCYGIGIEIAGLCDYIVASEKNSSSIEFGAFAVRYGFMLGLGVSWRLVRKIGVPNAARFFVKSDVTDLATAYKIGIVDAIISGEKFTEEVCRFAQRVSDGQIQKTSSPFAPKIAMISDEEKKALARGCSAQAVSLMLKALLICSRIENFEVAAELDKLYFKKLFFSQNAKEGVRAVLKNEPPNFAGEIF